MLKPGDTFERYTVDEMIGQGGMGSVYRAHDARLDRRVAVKVISDAAALSSDASARLLREARSAAAFNHPNAVTIFDVGEIEGAPYIVMELVEGQTLREAMASEVPAPSRVGWLADVARALAAAHKRNLVHRDVKPENVMVRSDGVVKVLDFGIARRSGGEIDATAATALPTLTKEGVRVGTPLYMAPEQIRGDKLDGRADQFSWGVLAYELLAGRLPWRGGNDSLAVAASILTDTPDAAALAGAPDSARAVVLRALSKRPEDRFASMDDLVRALEGSAPAGAVERSRPSYDGATSDPKPRAPKEPSRDGAASSPKPRASKEPGRHAGEPSSKTPPPAPSATLAHRYSADEVREILAQAIDRQESRSDGERLGFEDLLAAAREVGVDSATLREASRELRKRQEEQETGKGAMVERDTWIRRKRRSFFRHLGVYLIVNTALALFGLLVDGSGSMLMVTLFWGIGLGIHGLRALTANEDDWQEMIEHKRRREQRWRRRSAVVSRAIDEGAALLLRTGETIRKRVDAEEPAKLRIAADSRHTAGDSEAEAEAIAAEAESQRHRRREMR